MQLTKQALIMLGALLCAKPAMNASQQEYSPEFITKFKQVNEKGKSIQTDIEGIIKQVYEFQDRKGYLPSANEIDLKKDPFSDKPYNFWCGDKKGYGFIIWSNGPDGDNDKALRHFDASKWDGDYIKCTISNTLYEEYTEKIMAEKRKKILAQNKNLMDSYKYPDFSNPQAAYASIYFALEKGDRKLLEEKVENYDWLLSAENLMTIKQMMKKYENNNWFKQQCLSSEFKPKNENPQLKDFFSTEVEKISPNFVFVDSNDSFRDDLTKYFGMFFFKTNDGWKACVPKWLSHKNEIFKEFVEWDAKILVNAIEKYKSELGVYPPQNEWNLNNQLAPYIDKCLFGQKVSVNFYSDYFRYTTDKNRKNYSLIGDFKDEKFIRKNAHKYSWSNSEEFKDKMIKSIKW